MSETPPKYLTIPPILQQQLIHAGTYRKFMKILWIGRYKTGKSFALASYPKPILAASGGDEDGISQYLDKTQGDVAFRIETPDQLAAFVDFAVRNVDHFRSCVLDPITLIYDDYQDAWSAKFGGEIKGKNWNPVKAPWKIFRRAMKRANIHVGMSAHLKEVQYENEAGAPGEKEKLVIKPVEMPRIERQLPYDADLMFQCHQQLDKKNRPTPIHEIEFIGGRRPRTIAPTDLYTGKKWIFDERKPESPWEKIIVPLLAAWEEGATDMVGFDGMDLDPRGAQDDLAETESMSQDYLLGSMLTAIAAQTSLAEYSSGAWPEKILPFIDKLTPDRKAQVLQAHEAKKIALGWKA